MLEDQVVITGMGAIGPFGSSIQSLWDALLSGQPLLCPDEDDTKGGLCGRIPDDAVPEPLGPGAGGSRSVSTLALTAADQAIAQAGLNDGQVDPTDVAIVYGTANGGSGMDVVGALSRAFQSARFEVLSMGAIEETLGVPSAMISIKHAYRGPVLNLPMGWGASGSALSVACDLLKFGLAPAVLLVVADELGHARPSSPRAVGRTCGLLSPNDELPASIRPFDRHANGTAWGEGAAALILESKSGATQRKRRIIANIAGCGMASSVSVAGAVLYDDAAITAAMNQALTTAGHPQVDAVYAGSHCNRVSDLAESTAITDIFTSNRSPVVTNIRGVLGDVGAVTSLYSVIAAAMTFQYGLLPGISGCSDPDPAYKIDIALKHRKLASPKAVLCNALSWDGVSNSVLLAACEEEST